MSNELFSTNRLNRRVVGLMGRLHALSILSQSLIEIPTQENVIQLAEAIERYNADADAMMVTLATLMRQVDSQDGEVEEIDGRVLGESGVEL